MERRLSEENVTLGVMKWLIERDWHIVTFDYPKSGTGVMLHPNIDSKIEKNKGGIIPDIIAVKDKVVLFFENKNRLYPPDFEKLNDIRENSSHSDALNHLLTNFEVEMIFYGVAFPNLKKQIEKSKTYWSQIDFLLTVHEEKIVSILHDTSGIFSQL